MDESGLVLRLKRIKDELLALKQTHKYGLNRTNFSTIKITEPLSGTIVDIRLTLQIDTRTNSEPFIELYANDFEYTYIGIYSWDWDIENKKITIELQYISMNANASDVSIISTKPISSYTWEEI